MATFKHILVPTDFSETADRALDVALSIAAKFDAKVTVLHAYANPASAYPIRMNDAIPWPKEDVAALAQTKLRETVDKARQRGMSVESQLALGDAWQEIIDATKKLGIDMIVMGTHGRRGLPRMLLGSVAEKVVRSSTVPVVTVS